MRYIPTCVFAPVFIISISTSLQAAELNLENIPGAPGMTKERSLHYGILASGTSVGIDDPDGTVDSASDSIPLNVLVTSDLYRNKRLVTQMYSRITNFEAGTENIGQDLTRAALNISLQYNTKVSSDTSLWWGGGIGAVSENYAQRHRITDTGTLAGNELEERDETGVQGVIGASFEWKATRLFSLGLHAQYEAPFQDTAEVASVGLYFLY